MHNCVRRQFVNSQGHIPGLLFGQSELNSARSYLLAYGRQCAKVERHIKGRPDVVAYGSRRAPPPDLATRFSRSSRRNVRFHERPEGVCESEDVEQEKRLHLRAARFVVPSPVLQRQP